MAYLLEYPVSLNSYLGEENSIDAMLRSQILHTELKLFEKIYLWYERSIQKCQSIINTIVLLVKICVSGKLWCQYHQGFPETLIWTIETKKSYIGPQYQDLCIQHIETINFTIKVGQSIQTLVMLTRCSQYQCKHKEGSRNWGLLQPYV